MANTWTYAYTGAVQTWTAPRDGIYKIDLYGGAGGGVGISETSVMPSTLGCKGGHLTQYIQATAGTPYYINVGGAGYDLNHGLGSTPAPGGYNGGGNGKSGNSLSGWHKGGAGGGGATSIATVSGLLKDIGTSYIIGVAGGGGGAMYYTNGTITEAYHGDGTNYDNTIGNAPTSGEDSRGYVGSGAGYYDGASPTYPWTTIALKSNRGRCYAVNAPTGYTNAIEYGVREGNGYAQIEMVSGNFSISLGDNEITAISLGSTDISAISVGGV